jgi:hypothetical protein
MKLNAVSVNPLAFTSGLRIESQRFPGVFITARSADYRAYVVARDALLARLNRSAGASGVDPLLRNRELGKLAAEHLLVNLEGLEDDKGEPLAYNHALGQQVMTEQELGPLANEVWFVIAKAGDAQGEALDTQEKN